MAFKMRSGNKSSFKDMGSSPAKETGESKIDLSRHLKTNNSDGLEGGFTGVGGGTEYERKIAKFKEEQNAKDAKTAQDLAEKNAKKIDENSKKIKPTKAEEETAARKSRTESMNSMPWNKDVKAKLADPTKTATSKREQRANYKAAKENARKDDGKISKKEKQDINRERDITRSNTAAANGTSTLSFNVKNAVLSGQGLQGGIDIVSKSKKIDDKMAKQDANRASKKAAKATKVETNNKATERRSKTTIGKISNNIRKGVKDFVPNLKKTVKGIGENKKVKEKTTNTPTTTSTPKVENKSAKNNTNFDYNTSVAGMPVSPYGDGTIQEKSNIKVSVKEPSTPNVEKEVKKADAKKPKYVPSLKGEKLKGNLVVNQDLINKKVTNEKVDLNSKNSGPKAVVKEKVKEVLVKSNKVDYANSLLKK